MPRLLAALLLGALASCHPGDASPPDAGVVGGVRRAVSDDILARAPETSKATVKHILVSWGDLIRANPRRLTDPRAMNRTRAQAELLALEVLDKARAGDDFNQLMSKFSEDPVTGRLGAPIEVRPTGQLEPGFQALGLRLHVGEVGICQTAYGFHVVQRVQ